MLYKNYSIWIERNTTKEKNPEEGDWEGFIYEEFCILNRYNNWDSWALCIDAHTPKEVFELAKLEIELREIEYLKGRMKRSVDKILKLDKRNNKE